MGMDLGPLVLDRETVRTLTPSGVVEMVGKKTKKGDTCVWPQCPDKDSRRGPECREDPVPEQPERMRPDGHR